MEGKVAAVCRSVKKGTVKKEIKKGKIIEGFGLKGDAHGGDWHRQISLLAKESIDKFKNKVKGNYELNFGDFAENITTQGVELHNLPIGSKIEIGEKIVLEITQIGKECHHDCEIYQEIGNCIMPKEGIFAKVLNGGEIEVGDNVIMI